MEKLDWKKLVEEREQICLSGIRQGTGLEPEQWGDGEHYEHIWKNGILDTLFDRLEEEIERVNKKLGLE